MTHNPERDAPLKAGQLARLVGVTPDTLRHYERVGVLPPPPRSPNGYRIYPTEAVVRVKWIQHALAVGFTLEELARILKVRDSGGAPCRNVRALAESKLVNLEARIEELQRLRDDLKKSLRDWDQRLRKTPRGQRAWLLNMLLESGEPSSRRPSSPISRPATRKKEKPT